MKKKRIARIMDFTSLSDLFMLLSVLFLIMYSVNSLRTGLIALSERQQAQKKLDELSSLTSIARFNTVNVAYSSNHKEVKQLKKELNKLARLEKKAVQIKEKQKKLLDIAIDREINLKKYRAIVESSLYSHFGMKNELSKKVIEGRDLKRASLVYQNQLASKNHENKLIQRELDYYKSQEVDYYEDLMKKKRIIASVKKNIDLMTESYKKQNKAIKKITKQLQQKVNENLRLQKSYEDRIAKIGSQKISEIDKMRERMNHVYDEKHRVEVLNSDLSKTIKNIKKELMFLKNRKDSSLAQENMTQILSSQLSVALKQRGQNESKILELENNLGQLEKKLGSANKKIKGQQSFLSSLMVNQLNVERNLASFKEEGSRLKIAKEKLIGRIESAFKGQGLNTSLNRINGDLTFNFKKVYFDFGSDNLKEEMKLDLESIISKYAKAVMGDKELSKLIKEIEVVGSASPTLQGRFVNMMFSDPETIRKAMNINVDLSYNRAKKIFNHLFNNPSVVFEHKNKMFPLLKVSGEGFHRGQLPKGESYESLGEMPDFCMKFDCTKYQVVKLRFKLH